MARRYILADRIWLMKRRNLGDVMRIVSQVTGSFHSPAGISRCAIASKTFGEGVYISTARFTNIMSKSAMVKGSGKNFLRHVYWYVLILFTVKMHYVACRCLGGHRPCYTSMPAVASEQMPATPPYPGTPVVVFTPFSGTKIPLLFKGRKCQSIILNEPT